MKTIQNPYVRVIRVNTASDVLKVHRENLSTITQKLYDLGSFLNILIILFAMLLWIAITYVCVFIFKIPKGIEFIAAIASVVIPLVLAVLMHKKITKITASYKRHNIGEQVIDYLQTVDHPCQLLKAIEMTDTYGNLADVLRWVLQPFSTQQATY